MTLDLFLYVAIQAAIKAGEEIMPIYNSEILVELKEDNSPLTLADKKSNEIITEYLKETPYPILSEEGKSIPYNERKNWERFWLIDPLDGTKEFIKRNGEFTVNIALIENGIPIIGVIYVPVTDCLYFASKERGSFIVNDHNLDFEFDLQINDPDKSNEMSIAKHSGIKLPLKNNKRPFTVVASRSHLTPETETFINNLKEKHGEVEMISSGSSLKLCLVAEGKADVYPRLAPTMEWDTAAGQAIAECAGKQVLDYNTKLPLTYNKENLLNPSFIVQ
jgi:3'(2'), 5'-bisphosphate nucleotidase